MFHACTGSESQFAHGEVASRHVKNSSLRDLDDVIHFATGVMHRECISESVTDLLVPSAFVYSASFASILVD